MRARYWTCSRFADWIRGTPKGGAKTSKGWREWKKESKENHPIRYWIAEEGLRYLQEIVDFIPDKLHAVKYYINNRWVSKTHSLTANPRDIKPGTWRDVGDRFLPCLFNELQDFVEIELAWKYIAWAKSDVIEKFKPPFWARGWFRWRTWRCPEAGLADLEWQMNLVLDESHGANLNTEGYGQPTSQAKSAKEIYDLYIWWTKTRPNRQDPYESSGWDEYCKNLHNNNNGDIFDTEDVDPSLRKKGNISYKKLIKLEEQYRAEDEKMLIRLIKIRDHLWT